MVSFIKKLFPGGRGAARAIYRTIIDQSRQPDFYVHCGVPDTPNGRFELLALHLFLVMHRLKDEEEGKALARALSEQAVQDFDQNLREMGVGDLSVGREVKSLAEGLYGRMGAYTDGLVDGGDALAQALRRNVFANVEPNEIQIAAVASYCRREADALKSCELSSLIAGQLKFGHAPGGSETT